MGVSALKGVFQEFTATYSVETGGTTTDEYGNPIPEVESGSLVVNFEASTNPQLVFMEGADPKIVRGKGSCINPAVLPTALGPGSELAMTWRGTSGTLRILQVTVDPLAVLDETLGSTFLAEWRATSA